MTELELTNAADADACAREELLGLVAHALLSHVAYHAAKYGATSDPIEFYGADRVGRYNGFANGVETDEIVAVLAGAGICAWDVIDEIGEVLGERAAEAMEAAQ